MPQFGRQDVASTIQTAVQTGGDDFLPIMAEALRQWRWLHPAASDIQPFWRLCTSAGVNITPAQCSSILAIHGACADHG